MKMKTKNQRKMIKVTLTLDYVDLFVFVFEYSYPRFQFFRIAGNAEHSLHITIHVRMAVWNCKCKWNDKGVRRRILE